MGVMSILPGAVAYETSCLGSYLLYKRPRLGMTRSVPPMRDAQASAPSFATQCLHDRRGESRGMARVRGSYEVVIDYDWRILHPGCTGGFSVGLHNQFGVRHAVIEPRHAAPSNDLRPGCQHRPPADASDNSASSVDVLYELGYARIFGKQGRAFCAAWN